MKSGSAFSTAQPRLLKTLRCASRTAATAGSTGRPPRSRDQAILVLRKFLFNGRLKTVPGSSMETGERGSGPAIADRRKAVSSTVRPSGPSTLSVFQALGEGQAGTRPGVGRKPMTLQKLPGLRRLAARSPPSAKGSMPHATATAAPPDEPPQVRVASYGFLVAPKTLLNVWLPAANSGRLVLPRVIAPAADRRWTSR